MLKLVSDLNRLLYEIGKCDDEDAKLTLSTSFKDKIKSYIIATSDDIIKVLCDLYAVLPESESGCKTNYQESEAVPRSLCRKLTDEEKNTLPDDE